MSEAAHDTVEAQEILLNPGREHLRGMSELASLMVHRFGKTNEDDPSRTMNWSRNGHTYFLGRGGPWQDLTGELRTDENWLLAINDETGQFATHLISEGNEALAGNSAQREEVAAILCAEAASQVVADLALITDASPKRVEIFGRARSYLVRTFTDGAVQFALVDYWGKQYQVAEDVGIIATDPNVAPRQDRPTPLHGPQESALSHLLTVVPTATMERPKTPPKAAEQPNPHIELDQLDTLVQDVDRLINWDGQEGAAPPGVSGEQVWPNIHVYRMVMPAIDDHIEAAVGVYSDHGASLTIEVFPIDKQVARREAYHLSLPDAVVTCVERQSQGFNKRHEGGGAYEMVHGLLAAIYQAATEGTLRECSPDVAARFEHLAMRVDPPLDESDGIIE